MSHAPKRWRRAVARNAEGRILAWIPGSFATASGNLWRERTQKCMEKAIRDGQWMIADFPAADFPKLVVVTAYVWNSLSHENLCRFLGHVVNGLGDAGLIRRAGPISNCSIRYRQEVNRKHRGIEVVVEPLGYVKRRDIE